MNHYDKAKKTISIIFLIVVGTVLLQSCSVKNVDNSATTQPAEVEFEKLKVEIDKDNNLFILKSEELNQEFKGMILTYDYPNTANVYKIVPYSGESVLFYNPIKDWQRVWFQALPILNGQTNIALDGTVGKDRLSRLERKSVIESLTRVDVADFKHFEIIKTAYPNVTFGNYVLRYTYPVTSSDLYDIRTFDLIRKKEVTADIIKERPFDYYVIRRTFDGIIVGTPENLYTHYDKYDAVKKEETYISSENWNMYYDGTDIYEVHDNDKATVNDIEVYQSDQPILSLEQALKKAAPTLYRFISDSEKETKIYAVELVYLTVQVSDMSNVDYYNVEYIPRNNDVAYLYPYWVVYIHSDYMSMGFDEADHRPLLINAITGEVIVCN